MEDCDILIHPFIPFGTCSWGSQPHTAIIGVWYLLDIDHQWISDKSIPPCHPPLHPFHPKVHSISVTSLTTLCLSLVPLSHPLSLCSLFHWYLFPYHYDPLVSCIKVGALVTVGKRGMYVMFVCGTGSQFGYVIGLREWRSRVGSIRCRVRFMSCDFQFCRAMCRSMSVLFNNVGERFEMDGTMQAVWTCRGTLGGF